LFVFSSVFLIFVSTAIIYLLWYTSNICYNVYNATHLSFTYSGTYLIFIFNAAHLLFIYVCLYQSYLHYFRYVKKVWNTFWNAWAWRDLENVELRLTPGKMCIRQFHLQIGKLFFVLKQLKVMFAIALCANRLLHFNKVCINW